MTPTQALTPQALAESAQRLLNSYGNAMYWQDADLAEQIAGRFSLVLAALSAAPAGDPVAPQRQSLRIELQEQCVEWSAYWRAPDAHGVELTHEQATELLRRALGVEVEVLPVLAAPAPAEPAPEGWQHAGHIYNLVAHALMDADAPHGGCKHRLRLLLEELAPLAAAPASPKG